MHGACMRPPSDGGSIRCSARSAIGEGVGNGQNAPRMARKQKNKPVVVIGSINMDLVCRIPYIPRPGETILGSDLATIPGGKGANQAVAAAKLGADVYMIGRVGSDDFGMRLVTGLK